MPASDSTVQPFLVKNCSLAAIATGERVGSLVELHDKLVTADESCVYYHFWGGRMNPQFVHTQHHNDFSIWAYHRLHDHILAERLSIIDPTEFNNLEALRQEVLETIERRLDEHEVTPWTKKEDRFAFIKSTIIVFESSVSIATPEDLSKVISMLPPSSIFYHFIDARGRTESKRDDFSIWLKMFGTQYDPLVNDIQAIDPYFLSLTQLREELGNVMQRHFDGRRKS